MIQPALVNMEWAEQNFYPPNVGREFLATAKSSVDFKTLQFPLKRIF